MDRKKQGFNKTWLKQQNKFKTKLPPRIPVAAVFIQYPFQPCSVENFKEGSAFSPLPGNLSLIQIYDNTFSFPLYTHHNTLHYQSVSLQYYRVRLFVLQFRSVFPAIIESKLYLSVKNESEVGNYIREHSNGLTLFGSEVLQ